MKKMLLILTLIILSTGTLFAQTLTEPSNFGTSTGLIGDPYFISELDNLYWLSQTSAEWDKYYEQTVDIVASSTSGWDGGAGFSPIGNGTTAFTGSYDGGSYIIDGLTINLNSYGDEYIGLFGATDGSGTIQSLGLTNVNIVGYYYVGALIGYPQNTNIISCYSAGSVTGTDGKVGGLIGSCYDSYVNNCYSTASVSGSNDVIGGLIGEVWSGSTVNNCYSEGSVTGTDVNYVGGLAGYVYSYSSTINNCYSEGSVSGQDQVGGLVGELYDTGIINRSYSTGTVIGSNHIGGLVGYSYDNTEINNCYSTGPVSGSDESVGGFVGYAYSSTVSNCYSRGDVTGSGSETDIGAFCGMNYSTIEYCYSTGSVYYGDPDADLIPSDPTDPTDKGFVGAEGGTPTFILNYWSSEVSNQSGGLGAANLTADEMKTHTRFTMNGPSNPGWDFEGESANGTEDYWDMDYSGGAGKISVAGAVAINDGYPYLSWEDGDDFSLPVELTTFTVEATNQGVLCEWTTESEIENLGFILERKTDDTEWQEIASYKTDDGLLGQGSLSSATDYEYLDNLVEPNTTYEYRLADVDYNGIVTYHATREVTVGLAPLASKVEKFTVLPAYPNPFNPTTTIRYGIDTDSKITVQIYDITGQLITTLINTEQTQGWHSVVWNGTNNKGTQAPAGIYLSKITSNNRVKTTKLMLLK
jgi:hypothetical protein